MHKLMLHCQLSVGDLVMLTAAVRDLHRCCPGGFVTDVRTSCPELWLHNPHLTPLSDDDPDVLHLQCEYPLVNGSNQLPYHFIHGYLEDLGFQLGLELQPTEFRGDIHLSDEERRHPSPVAQQLGLNAPYWIIVAGGKWDYTIKWWSPERWQRVVDHWRGRLLFVQVGEDGHFHPPLRGVLDLRGRTSLRELIRLVHRADGVLCPVTSLMHLAAAVPAPEGWGPSRPCVVVAGGREPPHWEAYPSHQFIHTVGALPCCATGGCWRARTRPLGDGDEKDLPHALCLEPVGDLPRCMDMISVDEVNRRLSLYCEGRMTGLLTAEQACAAEAALANRHAVRDVPASA